MNFLKNTMAGSSATGGYNQTYQLLMTNYQTALLNPLTDRCVQLSHLLYKSPAKELECVFQNLVEHVFGFRSGIDWGLLTLEKDMQAKEFDAVRRFLAPDGPLLKLIYKFIEDSSPKFEFPVSCIPAPSQMLLQEGKVPTVYANKLQILNPGMFPSTIQIKFNAFEFYFFHFSLFIVNSSRNTLSGVNQQDTLYAHVLEDYFCYFLPSDNRAVPLYQPSQNVQNSPISSASLSSNYGSPHGSQESFYNRSLSRPDYHSPIIRKPSLLKEGSVLMMASSGSSTCGFGSPQTECWKAETFLLILIEMLLNQNVIDQQQSVVDFSRRAFVPSHYHVWMVRILVKHLHFFFNSSLSSSASGHGQIMIDSLGRLKGMGMTKLMQKEMYCFLKSTFDHWPLDASFRVPLETWLSYIQPWRYLRSDLDSSLWQKYMTENVLFYTLMFQQVLRRFLRMDFNCPKNAYMLFRVTKVFACNGMREMIMQAERGCTSKPSSLNMSSSYIQRTPEKPYSLRKVSHLECPGASYIPIFSEPVFTMVSHLLSVIALAHEKSQYNNMNPNTSSQSFLSKIASFFETSADGYNSEDNSPADIKKVSSYLEASIKQLCCFFKEVNPPVLNAPTPLTFGSASNLRETDGPKINPLQVLEKLRLLNLKKKVPVVLEGNPDLQPVRTYEIERFVIFLTEFARQLNEKHATEICRLYNMPNIWGKVWRKILAKPVTYYETKKSKDMMSVKQTEIHLPPRIYLRFLADKHLISYFFLFLLVTYWLGYPVLGVFFLFCTAAMLLFISAILYPVPIEDKPKQS